MALTQLHKQKKKTNICLFNFVWDAPMLAEACVLDKLFKHCTVQ